MTEQQDVEIVAVADICPARRQLVVQQLPNARVYTDYEILLEQEGAELDFVDIATPPNVHADIAIAAMRKGLHVLCEKPLTTTPELAEQLIQEAVRNERVIFPCHNYKHAPVVKTIRQIVESGRIGRVRSVTLSTFRNTHAKGVTEWFSNWRRDARYSGGGIAMDHGSHTFYLTFEWLDSYPTHVTAKMSTLDSDRYDTEDNFSAVATFPSGLAHVHLTWTAGVRKVIYTLQGEKGALTVEDDNIEVAVQQPTSGEDVAQGAVQWSVERISVASQWMDASHVQWFNSLFDQFRRAIDSKDYVGKEAREAVSCVRLIHAAYESARAQSVEVPVDCLKS